MIMRFKNCLAKIPHTLRILLMAVLVASGVTIVLLWRSSIPAEAQTAATYYISPSGDDENSGLTAFVPFKTFAKAFSVLPAGGELILMDGTYGEAQGTGYINWEGTNSGQIPSGVSRSQMTYVHALNPGRVKIMGALLVGRSSRKDSYIRIEGITFDGGTTQTAGELYNTSYVMIKNCGFRSESQGEAVLGIGTNDGDWGNSYDLLQDIWVWGKERIVLIIYRSDHIVVRRAVTRHDGCYSSTLGCGNNSGNYIVGTTIYNSNNVSFQNVIAVDNILGPNGYDGGGDFYVAWHDNYIYPWHQNEWIGTISLHSGLSQGYGYDMDNMAAPVQPMATYKDIVAWDISNPFNAQLNCGEGCAAQNLHVSNATLRTFGDDGFRIASNMSAGSHTVNNLVVLGTGRFGVNSVAPPAYVDVNGVWSEGAYNQASCTVGCRTSNPLADGSLKYLPRIENGSP